LQRRLDISARSVQRRLVTMGLTVIDMSPWDPERVERLSQLWRDGRE
jgi:hypothetical protein